MSTPNINPADFLGLVGGLLNQRQSGSDPLGLNRVFSDIFGEPEVFPSGTSGAPEQPKWHTSGSTYANDTKRSSAPSASRVAADVFTAGGSVADFLKDRFPKKDSPAAEASEHLSDLLVEMLAEHDGFGGMSEGKRESLYRATAEKWATRIQGGLSHGEAPEAAVQREETSPTVTEVAVEVPETPAQEPAVEEKPVRKSGPVDPKHLDSIAAALHFEKSPEHSEWSLCKETNIACRYNYLGQALVIIQNT